MAADLLQLGGEARDLGLDIHQPLDGHVDGSQRADTARHGPLRRIVHIHAQLFRLQQRHDRLAVRLDLPRVAGIGGPDAKDGGLLVGQVVLRPQDAPHADEVVLAVHILDHPRIDPLRGAFRRPFGHHDALCRMVVAHAVPQFLGQERHEGVQQAQGRREGVVHHLERMPLLLRRPLVERRLGIFDVPVAEGVPEEIVQRQRRVVEAVALQVVVHGGDGLVQLGQQVLVVGRQRRRIEGEVAHIEPLRVHLHEAGGVPYLGAEVAADLELFVRDVDILPRGRNHQQRETQGVGAVFLDNVERIDGIAEALGHLAALVVAHGTVDVDRVEGDVAHHLQAGHHHARHPEEDDLAGGHQRAGGIVELEVRALFRPPENAEGPEPGGEPGIEHILVLPEAARRADRALFGVGARRPLVAARVAVEDGDAVAPPDLARDTPVADVLHPAHVGLVPALGNKADAPVVHRLDGRAGQRLHLHEPLRRKARLHDRVAAVAVAHRVAVRLDLFDQSAGLEILDQLLAAREAVQPLVGAGILVHDALVGHHIDLPEAVALPHLKVVGVVRGRNLHHAGSKLRIDIVVGNHRNLPVQDRQDDRFADQILVALVARVDRHGGVAQHRLRPRGGHHHPPLLALDGVAQMVERALGLHMLALLVGKRGFAAGAPVDDAVAAIDQILLVEAAEDFAHGLAQPLVHRKAFALPVAGGPQLLELVGDGRAILPLPLPDAFNKLFAAQVVAALALLAQGALHHILGGNARVVGSRNPHGVLALHAGNADEHILDIVVERVAHVQDARHIRRGNHDAERLAAILRLGVEAAIGHPLPVPLLLDLFGFVVLR